MFEFEDEDVPEVISDDDFHIAFERFLGDMAEILDDEGEILD